MNKQKLWTKPFIIDCLICFLVNLAYYMTMVVVTDYALKTLRASLSEAGFACGIIILGVLAARLAIGRSIERIGTKKCLAAGVGIFLVSSIANLWVENLELLYLIRFVQGIGFGAASAATATIMAQLIPNERRGEGTSYFAMSVTLGTAIGPLLGLYVYRNGDLSGNLLVGSIALFICSILTFMLSAPAAPIAAEEPDTRHWLSLSSFVEVRALPIAAITFFIAIGFAALLGFLSPYTAGNGLAIGGKFFFMSYAASTLVSRPLTGRLFDMKGDNVVMLPAFLLFATGLCLLGLAHSNAAVLISGALIGLGFGTYMSCAQAIIIKLSPANRMGLANSTFFIFMDLGVGLGPLLLGKVVQALNYSGMYLFMAAVVLVCLGPYYYLHGRNVLRPSFMKVPHNVETKQRTYTAVH